jgi:outer membrane protein OmpA-like peptidoglycan-associated protein
MKKFIALVFTVSFAALLIAGCKSKPPALPADLENPNAAPQLTVTIPELFSPSPDIADDPLTINIAVNHPVPIKEWQIVINRYIARQAEQNAESQPAPRQRQSNQRSRNFYDHSGKGTPPEAWQWNGKRASGEMVQSATDYTFTLTVTDVFENAATYNGIISVDVLVRREGDQLRMIVPSIVFPPNAADLALVTSEDDRRSNTRVLRLIANALNKYPDYAITVEGHANPTTAPNSAARKAEDAEPLSGQRAQAVIDYLVANNGIAAARLKAVGMGGTKTVAPYNDAEENWKNRRVEFILHK